MSPNRRLYLVALAAGLLGIALGAGMTARLLPRTVVREAAAPADQAHNEAGAIYTPVDVSALPGWSEDTVVQALPGLKRACHQLEGLSADAVIGNGPIARKAGAWRAACSHLDETADGDAAVRATLEREFVPYRVSSSYGVGDQTSKGMFTGYYEAELNGSLVQTGNYQIPIYGPPRDIVTVNLRAFLAKSKPLPAGVPDTIVGRLEAPDPSGQQRLRPYYTREEIDNDHAIAGAADVILWADDPVAVHILHIQGSGRVSLPDGQTVRIGFAGHNGRAFKGIGAILTEAGQLQPGGGSMIAVRDWLHSHPDQAVDYMNRNTRYIFFRRITAAEGDGPIGALGVPLTAGRSIAVDQRYIPLGAPVWLDVKDPDDVKLQRLVVAEDIGAAITGPVRGDYFWGHGEDAFHKAARMRSQGSYFVFIPRELPGA